MTENTSRTHEFSIDQIVRHAWILAGGMNFGQPLTETRGQYGRELLEVTIKELEAQGLQVRTRDFSNLQLTAGTDRYTLAADILDVTGAGAYIAESETDIEHASSETSVRQIDSSTWQDQSAKDAQGRPTTMYAHRFGAQIELRLWPIPDENGTIRIPVQLLYPDATDGSKTPGLERPWAKYLIHELAHLIAESQSKTRDKIRDLERKAARFLERCKGFSNQHTDAQVVVDHDCGYYR